MPRAVVVLPDPLSSVLLAGRRLADHWSALLSEAGLAPGAGDGPCLVVDGRFAAMSCGSLRALAETLPASGGALLAGGGRVVAAARTDGQALLEHPGGRTLPLPDAEAFDVEHGWGLARAERAVVDRVLRRLAGLGVRLVDPERIWVEPGVKVEPGATLWGGCVLRGRTHVAAGATVMAGAWLEDTTVGPRSVIKPHTVCEGAVIGAECAVGPSAHLRPGTVLDEDVKVGNYVEVKKAHLERGVRASHLTYLGDAHVRQGANVGAGTITCNYDGFGKHHTEIGAGAFIGSNSSLVAPVRIGAGAIVGAGSTITREVPDQALAVERAEERVLAGKAPTINERNRRRAEAKRNG